MKKKINRNINRFLKTLKSIFLLVYSSSTKFRFMWFLSSFFFNLKTKATNCNHRLSQKWESLYCYVDCKCIINTSRNPDWVFWSMDFKKTKKWNTHCVAQQQSMTLNMFSILVYVYKCLAKVCLCVFSKLWFQELIYVEVTYQQHDQKYFIDYKSYNTPTYLLNILSTTLTAGPNVCEICKINISFGTIRTQKQKGNTSFKELFVTGSRVVCVKKISFKFWL